MGSKKKKKGKGKKKRGNRKLSAEEKAEKRRRRREYMTIFVGGKQKRVKRPPTIDGMPVDEFIENNADPIWLHQHGMHEVLYQQEREAQALDEEAPPGDTPEQPGSDAESREFRRGSEPPVDDIPF